MADVWRARDTELGRDVALKLLHENFARDTEFVERFRREASSAAGLQHPNVVSVFDRGTYEDSYYISMELVEGSSLRDLIDQGLDDRGGGRGRPGRCSPPPSSPTSTGSSTAT